ncbi:MAG: hypothetical protein HQ518_17530 [Rhodopirellula sp.]|nr:hypothetical protein [Rhodopirellula sp.]
MSSSESKCPVEPHAHVFLMKCYRCEGWVKVIHDCGFNKFLDPDSPNYDEAMKAKREALLRSSGIPLDPSKTTGELGVVCESCGALQGAHFIKKGFLEIAYTPESYETVVMPMNR